MLKRYRIHSFLCLLAGIIVIIQSCQTVPGTSEEAPVVKTPVTIVPVTFKSVSSTVDSACCYNFMKKSIVRATTTGTIEKISY